MIKYFFTLLIIVLSIYYCKPIKVNEENMKNGNGNGDNKLTDKIINFSQSNNNLHLPLPIEKLKKLRYNLREYINEFSSIKGYNIESLFKNDFGEILLLKDFNFIFLRCFYKPPMLDDLKIFYNEIIKFAVSKKINKIIEDSSYGEVMNHFIRFSFDKEKLKKILTDEEIARLKLSCVSDSILSIGELIDIADYGSELLKNQIKYEAKIVSAQKKGEGEFEGKRIFYSCSSLEEAIEWLKSKE